MSLSSNLTNGEVTPTGGGGFNPAPKSKESKESVPKFNPAPVKKETTPVAPVQQTAPVVPAQVTPEVKETEVTPLNPMSVFQQQKDLAIAKKIAADSDKNKKYFQSPDMFKQDEETEEELKRKETGTFTLPTSNTQQIESGQSLQMSDGGLNDFELNEAKIKDKPFKPYELSKNDRETETNSGSSQKYLESNGVDTKEDYSHENDFVPIVDTKHLSNQYKKAEEDTKKLVSESGMLKNLHDREALYKTTLEIKKKLDDKEAIFTGSEQYVALNSLDKSVKDLAVKIKEVSDSDEFKAIEETAPLVADVKKKFDLSQEFVKRNLEPMANKLTKFKDDYGTQKKDEKGNIVTEFSPNELTEFNKIKSEYESVYNQYKLQEQQISSITSSNQYKAYFSDATSSLLTSYDELVKSYNLQSDEYKKAYDSFNSLLTSDKDYQDAKKQVTDNIANLDAMANYVPNDNDLVAKVMKLHPDVLDKPEKFNEYLNNEIQSTLNDKRYNILKSDGFVGEIPQDSEKEIIPLLTSNEYINATSLRKKALLVSFHDSYTELYKDVPVTDFLSKYQSTITPPAELKIIKSSAKEQDFTVSKLRTTALTHAQKLESYTLDRGGKNKLVAEGEVGQSYVRLNTAKKLLTEFENLDYQSYGTFKDGLKKASHGLSQTSLTDWIPFVHSIPNLADNKLTQESIRNVDLKKNEYKTKGGQSKLGISEEDYVLQNTKVGEYEIYKAMSTLNSFNTLTSQGFGYQLGKQVFPNLVTFMGEMYAMNSFSLGSVVPESIQNSVSSIVKSGFSRYGIPAIDMSSAAAKSFTTIFSIIPKATALGQTAIVADTYRRMTNVDSYYFSTDAGNIINEQITKGTDPSTAYLKSFLMYNMEAATEGVGTAAEALNLGSKLAGSSKTLIAEILEQSQKAGVVADDLIEKFSVISKIPFNKAKAVISALGNRTSKLFMNGLIYNDLSQSLIKNLGKAFNPKSYLKGGLSDFFEKAGVNGMGWEYVEEFLSNRLSPLIEGTHDDFYDNPIANQIEEFKETTAALSPLLLLGAGSAVVNSGIDLYRYGADKISLYNNTLSTINGASTELFQASEGELEKNIKSLLKDGKTDLSIQALENFQMRKRFEDSPLKDQMTFQQYQDKITEDANKLKKFVGASLKNNKLDVYEAEKLKEEVTELNQKEQIDNLIQLQDEYLLNTPEGVSYSQYVRNNEKAYRDVYNEIVMFRMNMGLQNFEKWSSYIDSATITDSRRKILTDFYDDSHAFYEENKDKMSFVNSFNLPVSHVAGSLTNTKERIPLNLVDGKYVFDKSFSKKDLISLLMRDINLSNISNIINISHVINNLKSPLNKNDYNAITSKIGAQLLSGLGNIDLIDNGNLSSFNNIITLLNKTDNVDVHGVREQVARILSNQSNQITNEEDLAYHGKLMNTLLANDKLFDYDFVSSLNNKVDFSFKKRDRAINEDTDFETGSIEDTIENMFANKSKNIKVDKQTLSELRKNKSFVILETKLNELEKSKQITPATKKLLIKVMQYLPAEFISFEDIIFNNQSNASYYNTANNTIYIANNSSQGTLIFEAVEEIVHSVYFNMLKEISGFNANSLIKDSVVEEISGKTKSQLIKSIVGFYNSKNYSVDRFNDLLNKKNLKEAEKEELIEIKEMLTNFKNLYKLSGKITDIDFVDKATNTHYTTESLVKSFNRFKFFSDNKRGYDFKQSIYFASDMKEYFARTMSDFLLNKISQEVLGKGFKSVANDIKRWCYKKIVVPVAKRMMNDSIIDEHKDELIDFLGGKIAESDKAMIEEVFDEMNRNYKKGENPFTTEMNEETGKVRVMSTRKSYTNFSDPEIEDIFRFEKEVSKYEDDDWNIDNEKAISNLNKNGVLNKDLLAGLLMFVAPRRILFSSSDSITEAYDFLKLLDKELNDEVLRNTVNYLGSEFKKYGHGFNLSNEYFDKKSNDFENSKSINDEINSISGMTDALSFRIKIAQDITNKINLTYDEIFKKYLYNHTDLKEIKSFSVRKDANFLRLDPEDFRNGVGSIIQNGLIDNNSVVSAMEEYLKDMKLTKKDVREMVLNNDISSLSKIQDDLALIADEKGVNSQLVSGWLRNPKGLSDHLDFYRRALNISRMAKSYIEETDLLDYDSKKNFDKWFGEGNFFQNEDGSPIIKYHYGEFADFKSWEFNPYLSDGGTHLGSFYSAVDRMKMKGRIGHNSANILGFAVKMKNPLIMTDVAQFEENSIAEALNEIKKGSFREYQQRLIDIDSLIRKNLPGTTGFYMHSPNTVNFKYELFLDKVYTPLLPTQLRDLIKRVNIDNNSEEYKKDIQLIDKYFSNDNLDYHREVIYSMLKENGFDGIVYINDYEGERSKEFIKNFGEADFGKPIEKTVFSLVIIDPKQVKAIKLNEGSFDESGNFAMSQRKEKINDLDLIEGFYSPIEKRLLETKIDRQSANKWISLLGKGEEAKWTGVKEWLESKEPTEQVSKSDIQNWMKDNRVEIKILGDNKISGIGNAVIDRISALTVEKDNLARRLESFGFTLESDMGGEGDILIDSDGEMAEYDELDDLTKEVYDRYGDIHTEIYDLENGDESQDNGVTKFHQYTLEGEKSNYKEILVTLPLKSEFLTESEQLEYNALESKLNNSNLSLSEYDRINELNDKAGNFKKDIKFQSSHFNEPNILVHLRVNTRIDSEGKKVLFIEEVQSDWGQQGKSKGFKDGITELPDGYRIDEPGKWTNWTVIHPFGLEGAMTSSVVSEAPTKEGAIRLAIERLNRRKIEQAPYVTDTNSWVKLGLKVALQQAIKEGADKIAWTTGEQQNDRYDLSKQVDEIRYKTDQQGRYVFDAYKNGDNVYGRKAVEEKDIESHFGKDVAQKMIDGIGEDIEGYKSLSANNLSVGGSGMKGFYGSLEDNKLGIIGNVAKSLFKQDVKNTTIEIDKRFDEGKVIVLRTPNKRYYVEISSNNKRTTLNDAEGLPVYFDSKEDARKYGDENIKEVLGYTQPSITITPELIAQVEEGLPAFSKRKELGVSKDFYNEAIESISNPTKYAQNKSKALKQAMFEDLVTNSIANIPTEDLKLIKDGLVNSALQSPKGDFLNKITGGAFSQRKEYKDWLKKNTSENGIADFELKDGTSASFDFVNLNILLSKKFKGRWISKKESFSPRLITDFSKSFEDFNERVEDIVFGDLSFNTSNGYDLMEDNKDTIAYSQRKENSLNQSDTDKIFYGNNNLYTIGTKDQYNDYLSSFFPKSKILYHATVLPFDEFDSSKSTMRSKDMGDGFYVSDKNNTHKWSAYQTSYSGMVESNLRTNYLMSALEKIGVSVSGSYEDGILDTVKRREEFTDENSDLRKLILGLYKEAKDVLPEYYKQKDFDNYVEEKIMEIYGIQDYKKSNPLKNAVTIPVLVNYSNPLYVEDGYLEYSDKYKNHSVVIEGTEENITQAVIPDTYNSLVLGGEKDVEMFKEFVKKNPEDTIAYSQRKSSSHNPTPVGTTTMSRDFYLALIALKGTGRIDAKFINRFLDTVEHDKKNIDNPKRVAKEGLELWARYYIQENAEKLGISKKSEIARLSSFANRAKITDYSKDVQFVVDMVENHGFRKLVMDVKAQQKISFNKSIREYSNDVEFYRLLKKLSSVNVNLFEDSTQLKEYREKLKEKLSTVDLVAFKDYVDSVIKKSGDAFEPSKQKAAVDEIAVETERQFKINQINFFKNHLVSVYGKNKMIKDFLNLNITNLSLSTINDYQNAISIIVNRGDLNKKGVKLYLKIKSNQIMEDYKASMDLANVKMLNSKVNRNAIRDYFSKLGNISYFTLNDLVDFLDGVGSEYSGQLVKALIDPIDTANKNHKKIYSKILENASLVRRESFDEEGWNIIGMFGLLNQFPDYTVSKEHFTEANEENAESLGGILYQQGITSFGPGTVLTHKDLNGADAERDLAYRTFLALSNQNIKEGLMLRFGEMPEGYTQAQVDAAVREQSHIGKSNKSLIGKSQLEKFKNKILDATGMSSIKELAEKMLSGEYTLDYEQNKAYEQILDTFNALHNGDYTDGVGVKYTSEKISGLDFDTIHNYFPIMRINDFEKFDTKLLASIGGKEIEQDNNFYMMQTGFNLTHSFIKKRKQVAMAMNTNALELFRIRSEQQLFYILNEQHRQLLKNIFDDGFFKNSDSEHSLDSDTSEYLKRLFDSHFNRGISKGYIRAMNSAWTRNTMKIFGAFQVTALSAIHKSPSQLSTIVNSMIGMKGSNVQKLSALKFGISEVFGDVFGKHKTWDDILMEHMSSVYFRSIPDYNLIGISGVNKKTTETYKPKNTLDKINQKYNDLTNSKQLALYFVSLFDRISARVCAISAYKNYLDVNNIPFDYGNINQDAVNFAINQVNQTQASDDLIKKPGVVQGVIPDGIGQQMLDTGLGYLLNKSFIAFQSFSINETRLMRKERASLIDSILSGDTKKASENAQNIAINIASRYVFQYIKRFCQVVVPLTAATMLTKGSGQDDENDLGHRYWDGSEYGDKIDFGSVSMQVLLDMFSTVKPVAYGVSKASQLTESYLKERDLTDDEKLKYAFTDKIFSNFYESTATKVAKTPVDLYNDYKGDHFMMEDAIIMFLQTGTIAAGAFDGGIIPLNSDIFDLVKEIRKQHESDIQREIKTETNSEDINKK